MCIRDSSGVADAVARFIIGMSHHYGPHVLLDVYKRQFLNNTPVVVIFAPIIKRWAEDVYKRQKHSSQQHVGAIMMAHAYNETRHSICHSGIHHRLAAVSYTHLQEFRRNKI